MPRSTETVRTANIEPEDYCLDGFVGYACDDPDFLFVKENVVRWSLPEKSKHMVDAAPEAFWTRPLYFRALRDAQQASIKHDFFNFALLNRCFDWMDVSVSDKSFDAYYYECRELHIAVSKLVGEDEFAIYPCTDLHKYVENAAIDAAIAVPLTLAAARLMMPNCLAGKFTLKRNRCGS